MNNIAIPINITNAKEGDIFIFKNDTMQPLCYSSYNKPLYDEIAKLREENEELKTYIKNILTQINEKFELQDKINKLNLGV